MIAQSVSRAGLRKIKTIDVIAIRNIQWLAISLRAFPRDREIMT